MEKLTSDGTVGQVSPWDRILAILEPKLGPGTFDTWFRPTRMLEQDGHTLRVGVPNAMFAEWLKTTYSSDIRSALSEAGMHAPARVEFVPPVERRSAERDVAELSGVSDRPRFNRRYTFSDFVVAPCNELAHAAALAVARRPGSVYNPLFLYGGVGLGKTHLMQAIGTEILRSRPEYTLRYVTAEQFMNDLIVAIREEKTQRFRERYRSADVLLIDDVQFLAGKESTQQEFFHTFNDLHQAGRQVVLTSDCLPRAIPALEERLRSRFDMGLLADLQPPDLETKIAILDNMAQAHGWALPPDVALFIASNIHDNVRELEGSLTTLVAAASIHGRPLSVDLAKSALKSLGPPEQRTVTLDEVFRVVARHFSLRVADLKMRTNARRIAFPRQIAMYLGKKVARQSLPAIGSALGGKHHTTVLHAVRKIDELRRGDAAIDKIVRSLEDVLA